MKLFSKPHARGREEHRLGQDLALCESKQKSLGTMNNKSIERKKKKKKSLSFGGRGERRRGTAVTRKRACTYALLLPGNTTGSTSQERGYMQNEADTMTEKPKEFPGQECGCSLTVGAVMGSDFFFFSVRD